MTADELLSSLPGQIGRPAVKLEEAVSILKEMLKDGQKLSASDCMDALNKVGIKRGTIMQAKKQAGIDSHKEGDKWFWSMPARNQEVNNLSVCSTDDDSNNDFDDF